MIAQNRIATLLNVEKWLQDRGVEFNRKNAKSNGRTVWQITCPMDPSHESPDACIMQDDKGKMSAKCLHDSCEGYRFADFRAKIGKPSTEHYEPCGRAANRTEEPEFTLNLVQATEFWDREYDDTYLIDGLVAAGESLIVGGAQKTLKTSTCIDLMVSMATGKPALGYFTVPAPVNCGIISGSQARRQSTGR